MHQSTLLQRSILTMRVRICFSSSCYDILWEMLLLLLLLFHAPSLKCLHIALYNSNELFGTFAYTRRIFRGKHNQRKLRFAVEGRSECRRSCCRFVYHFGRIAEKYSVDSIILLGDCSLFASKWKSIYACWMRAKREWVECVEARQVVRLFS